MRSPGNYSTKPNQASSILGTEKACLSSAQLQKPQCAWAQEVRVW